MVRIRLIPFLFLLARYPLGIRWEKVHPGRQQLHNKGRWTVAREQETAGLPRMVAAVPGRILFPAGRRAGLRRGPRGIQADAAVRPILGHDHFEMGIGGPEPGIAKVLEALHIVPAVGGRESRALHPGARPGMETVVPISDILSIVWLEILVEQHQMVGPLIPVVPIGRAQRLLHGGLLPVGQLLGGLRGAESKQATIVGSLCPAYAGGFVLRQARKPV